MASSADLEKVPGLVATLPESPGINGGYEAPSSPPPRSSLWAGLKRFNTRIESLSGLEARGISRVPPSERQAPSSWNDFAVGLLWFSANISVNNLAPALLGPLVFGLGFLDCAMCATFGAFLGSLSSAYMSIWGPQSGNRTMVCITLRNPIKKDFQTAYFLPTGCPAIFHGILAS